MATSYRTPNRDEVMQAIERRLEGIRLERPRGALYVDFDEDHPRRRHFRRLIDPGIIRSNSTEVTLKALQTMKTLAENILRSPDEVKFHRIKPTNAKILELLINPPGVVEYIREMGFNPEVDEVEWQPYYVFHMKRLDDLKMGLAIINETIERESPKQEREERALEEAKAAEAKAKQKIMLKFQDDRLSVRARATRERRGGLADDIPRLPPKSKKSPAVVKTLADLRRDSKALDDGESSGEHEPA
ncbi:hypothetical protein IEO21_00775 [Rhodonia placenta]|uniref:PUB domain-containing protein n=1 Tax=Rhodonia placenta TaxID=104341 RepID=A0A8H7U6P6_9APHY|nr:hypothetical protein IEO21_00775 [Postia placenta]